MDDSAFNELLASVRQAGAILRGEEDPGRAFHFPEKDGAPDVAAIRAHFGVSQQRFADMLGISLGTLRNWEQGRRRPEGPAEVLLEVAYRHPEAVLQVVRERRARYGPAGDGENDGKPPAED
jgi:putative transcriptional regulator